MENCKFPNSIVPAKPCLFCTCHSLFLHLMDHLVTFVLYAIEPSLCGAELKLFVVP